MRSMDLNWIGSILSYMAAVSIAERKTPKHRGTSGNYGFCSKERGGLDDVRNNYPEKTGSCTDYSGYIACGPNPFTCVCRKPCGT